MTPLLRTAGQALASGRLTREASPLCRVESAVGQALNRHRCIPVAPPPGKQIRLSYQKRQGPTPSRIL